MLRMGVLFLIRLTVFKSNDPYLSIIFLIAFIVPLASVRGLVNHCQISRGEFNASHLEKWQLSWMTKWRSVCESTIFSTSAFLTSQPDWRKLWKLFGLVRIWDYILYLSFAKQETMQPIQCLTSLNWRCFFENQERKGGMKKQRLWLHHFKIKWVLSIFITSKSFPQEQ